MARLFYSMAGEGRGHAARVRTLVEQLRFEHELWLFAPDDAFDFLAPSYGPGSRCPEVRLTRIPGLRFHYTHGRMDLWKSIGQGLSYAWHELPPLVRRLREVIRAERPDAVIVDFEPALPRAAAREGVPIVTIDHQHVLLADDLSSLPLSLQRYAWLMSPVIRWHTSGQALTIASAFYTPPLRRGWGHVHQVGPLLRQDVVQARRVQGQSLLSYLRPNTPSAVLQTLATAGRPVVIYGLGERPAQGLLSFRPIDERQFVSDLASCAACVCAAGNQLLGEALYLGKPVLALPEGQHHEQMINAHFISQMGVGQWSTLEAFQPAILADFLQRLDQYRQATAALEGRLDGTAATLQLLDAFLARLPQRQTARIVAGAA